MRAFIVETWERHRLSGIIYQCLLLRLTESTSLPIAVYLVLHFIHIWLFTIDTKVLKWSFFRAKQPLIIGS